MFYKLRGVRRQYKEALQGAEDNPFTIDDLRVTRTKGQQGLHPAPMYSLLALDSEQPIGSLT